MGVGYLFIEIWRAKRSKEIRIVARDTYAIFLQNSKELIIKMW